MSNASKFMLLENANWPNLKFELRVLVAFARSCEIKVNGGRRARCQRKQKKPIDQRSLDVVKSKNAVH